MTIYHLFRRDGSDIDKLPLVGSSGALLFFSSLDICECSLTNSTRRRNHDLSPPVLHRADRKGQNLCYWKFSGSPGHDSVHTISTDI